MSDRMRLIPFPQLMKWVLDEYKEEHAIFGVSSSKFYKKAGKLDLRLFGETLENPVGPAAGPNTQLAQNMIASYLAGGRFFELKTVQTLDGEDLPVSKPCILAQDEGYNVEWSTELTVPDAFNEYVKAWFVLNVLSRELSLGSKHGFIFNMSVGYDLEGISSSKIDTFIEGLKDASQTTVWKECRNYLLDNLGMFQHIDREFVEGISPHICQSITLSTLHGCPPAEIERVAEYLMEQKQLHTYVKCNPTLLGYRFVRETLDRMGYDYLVFDDHHFKNDLQFCDAVPMIARLKAFAKKLELTFGVKLTNTFPVQIKGNELPGEEMYMSGRSLYPLTINLACKLAKAFDGDLRISYSGGADYFNIHKIINTGIWPVTLATTILKPGGCLRLKQLADSLDGADEVAALEGIHVDRLEELAAAALTDYNHVKEKREVKSRKLQRLLPLTDCFIAPCTDGCPIGQDVPEYIRLTGEGRYREALEVIIAKNPLPFITGTLCNHRCTTKCTRIDYDESVDIRSVKLTAAQKGFEALISRLETPVMDSGTKVAVIGSGPAGLAAAYFLGKNGIDVTVFDKKEKAGGIIEHVAPDFRISKEAIENDMQLIRRMGVTFRLGVDPDFSVKALKEEGYAYIFLAIGAWLPGVLQLDFCDGEIINVLDFLETYTKAPDTLSLGKHVAVIGAGNSAMDAARSAARVAGVEKVYVVYRRTRKYMPADREELTLALQDGVAFKELLAPVSYRNGLLLCQQMTLGAPDSSGRRSPIPIPDAYIELQVDTLISAVGEKVETDLMVKNGILLDEDGRVQADPQTHETNVANVYIGGDALRGPATIVEGIADGTRFAKVVISKVKGKTLDLSAAAHFVKTRQNAEIYDKKGRLNNVCEPGKEAGRCLECGYVCNICAEVCPNRANIAVHVNSGHVKCSNQIVHIDGMCNECGNCEAFCPYDSAPYKDKLTLYWSREDFEDSSNAGFIADPSSDRITVRLGGEVMDMTLDKNDNCHGNIPPEVADTIRTVLKHYGYLIVQQ